uniref:Glycine receptor beta n=1 Tax=Macaca nemestrina TaxID=9545 RepID=A0A2K6CAN2_MACNE
MKFLLTTAFLILISLWAEEAYSKEKSSKKGKGKKKQYLCPSLVRPDAKKFVLLSLI